MSLLTMRVAQSLRRGLVLNSRVYCDKSMRFFDPLELAAGKEKAELMAIQRGNDDPFKIKAIKRRASSKSDPIRIPSYYDSRMVGCVCEEDSNHVIWFWLLMDEEPKRCQCGHWFKLEKYEMV